MRWPVLLGMSLVCGRAAQAQPPSLEAEHSVKKPGTRAAPPVPTPAAPAPVPTAARIDPSVGGGAATPVAPQVAFPGQYAPSLADRLHPSAPKACRSLLEAAERSVCFEHVAFHWPGLQRFAAANRLLAPPGPGERRVVFLGDSITDNWSKPTYGGFFPGRPYINRGIGGQAAAQMLVRFRSDVVELRPRAVVILAGTNDLAGNVGPSTPELIRGHLQSLAELARVNGIKVVLASLLPVRDDKPNAEGKPILRTADRPPAALIALNRWIADYARKNRHVFLDYHGAMVDGTGALRADLTNDGLHPNAAGYAVMAPLAEQAITRAIGGS